MKLSIIIPALNEEGNIIELNKKLINTLKDLDYELIYIDDGSKDNTLEKIKKVSEEKNDYIKYISFSKNFGKDAAIYAGLKKSTGDFICIIDSDLQQNPKYIISMYEYLKNNQDIDQIAMVMKDRKKENIFNRIFKKTFYYIINKLSDITLIDGASDFRMFRKNVKEAILNLPETNRFTKGIFSWIGFNTKYMYYEVEKRFSGKTKFNTKAQIKYALTGITNYSIKPLSIATILGLLISLISIIYIIIIITEVLVFGKTTPGYASQLVVTLFLGGLNLTFIGVIGTYVGKTYLETKKRPIFIEKETKGFDDEIL